MSASDVRRVLGVKSARPLAGLEFARRMAAVGPFETRPRLAIAVSGGADSLALALLADRWVRRRRGSLTALTVDHGLRPASAEEARQVGRWLSARRIAHRVLRWTGDKPRTGIQAAAREARYRLLTDWCAAHGTLHLLVAHHRDDQAETFLLRLAGQSGVDGLAGMAAVVEGPDVRLVRPLLAVPRSRLEATLRAHGQDWIEDPSNRNLEFARARIRVLLPALGAAGMGPSALTASARAAGRTREALEAATWALLARSTELAAEGYARVRLAPLRTASRSFAERALRRILLCVGGRAYPPRRERLSRLMDDLVAARPAKARTLAGCRIVLDGEALVVCPEFRVEPSTVRAVSGATARWADRFEIEFGATGSKGRAWIGALGSAGWSEVARSRPEIRRSVPPFPVRLGLPALFDEGGVSAVPHLGFRANPGGIEVRATRFRPRQTLSGPGFVLARDRSGTI